MKKSLKLAGQTRHKSLKEAFKAIEQQLGEIHVQTTDRVKLERRRR